jgi:hypothetical protein
MVFTSILSDRIVYFWVRSEKKGTDAMASTREIVRLPGTLSGQEHEATCIVQAIRVTQAGSGAYGCTSRAFGKNPGPYFLGPGFSGTLITVGFLEANGSLSYHG